MATLTLQNVLILMGGRSSEHEVSLTSAKSILKNIDTSRFNPIPVLITRDGQWFWLPDTAFLTQNNSKLLAEPANIHQHGQPALLDYTYHARLIRRTGEEIFPIDVIFPILHGPYGEDGTIQGLAKMACIPCVGAGILGSATGLDKIAMKQIFLSYHLPILPFVGFTRKEWEQNFSMILAQIQNSLQLPVFVKPANCGSSVGISKVKSWNDLAQAIHNATRFDRKILVEQGIDVRELECAILGNEQPIASPVGEVIPCREFYDYEAKYLADGSKTIVPAPIPATATTEVQRLAIATFQALDCAGLSRIDFFMDKNSQQIYVNEINTIPGFTAISMYPMLWKETGISYTELITRLLDLANAQFNLEKSEIQPS